MNHQKFSKTLSANDVGSTGSHQAGILVPKADAELLAFFPWLNPGIKNPDAWLTCVDEAGAIWSLRYIYYNNELHDPEGTRNEYRITRFTQYLKQVGARAGDRLEFESTDLEKEYRISLRRSANVNASTVIQLRGWNRVF